jgi:hypothetical protein
VPDAPINQPCAHEMPQSSPLNLPRAGKNFRIPHEPRGAIRAACLFREIASRLKLAACKSFLPIAAMQTARQKWQRAGHAHRLRADDGLFACRPFEPRETRAESVSAKTARSS